MLRSRCACASDAILGLCSGGITSTKIFSDSCSRLALRPGLDKRCLMNILVSTLRDEAEKNPATRNEVEHPPPTPGARAKSGEFHRGPFIIDNTLDRAS